MDVEARGGLDGTGICWGPCTILRAYRFRQHLCVQTWSTRQSSQVVPNNVRSAKVSLDAIYYCTLSFERGPCDVSHEGETNATSANRLDSWPTWSSFFYIETFNQTLNILSDKDRQHCLCRLFMARQALFMTMSGPLRRCWIWPKSF
jgi:hypothetical protein